MTSAGLLQARRALEYARSNEWIKQAVASAPPLDPATLSLLQALIPAPLPAVTEAPKAQLGKGIRSLRSTDAEAGGPDAA